MKKNVLLLGATGMLGSLVLDVISKEPSISLYATSRDKKLLKQFSNKYPKTKFIVFDALKNPFTGEFSQIKKIDWIINAIGLIKPFIHDDNPSEVEKAIALNAEFPFVIHELIKHKSTKVLQIATDCVFSGEKGDYVETDLHDPLDVYGKTKSLGEVPSSQFIHLRCSIIGPERNTQNSLLEWFVNQEVKSKLNGFTNHFWNGITTLHFAKICKSIILNDLQLENMQHIVPEDIVTKQKLLKYFSKHFQRADIEINPVKSRNKINRTLNTIHATMNMDIWKSAGYKNPPTIDEMVKELAEYMKA